jgi:hypothetical protein
MQEDQIYDSPILLSLESRGEPVPPRKVACTTCPVAMWYWPGEKQLICFCSALHRETWKVEWNPKGALPDGAIQLCDGREQARAKLEAGREERI